MTPRLEVGEAAEEVEQRAEVLALERDRHGVDGEVAPRRGRWRIVACSTVGQRRRVVVELGARRGDVDAQRAAVARRSTTTAVPNLSCGTHVAAERAARARAPNAMPSPSTAMSRSKLRLVQEQVAHGAADEVHAAAPRRPRPGRARRTSSRPRPASRPAMLPAGSGGGARRPPAARRRRSARVTMPTTSSRRAGRLAGPSPRRTTGTQPEGPASDHAGGVLERVVGADAARRGLITAFTGAWPEAVADGPVEVVARDGAGELRRRRATTIPSSRRRWQAIAARRRRCRRGDRSAGRASSRRRRAATGATARARRARAGARPLERRSLTHRRGGGGVAAAADGGERRGDVEPGRRGCAPSRRRGPPSRRAGRRRRSR